ncbi:hypothetical protein AMTR_s00146p00053840 [Amborella trichopoda]|uniref:FBD domain-containing protein n=1 Tax=Amborella trichopoda TaxID=13333 RepID=W1PB55_AMBTC|nr:hypothetical protein AMTR_s00146p00053840 [Amborella trichopoda]
MKKKKHHTLNATLLKNKKGLFMEMDCSDQISKLSDSILGCIISHLPMKDAVRKDGKTCGLLSLTLISMKTSFPSRSNQERERSLYTRQATYKFDLQMWGSSKLDLKSLAYKVIIANFPTWFPNLKKLNVQANMAKDLEAAVIAILLSSSLSLQDIVIQLVPRDFGKHGILQVVIKSFAGEVDEIGLVRFFLVNAKKLRKIRISCYRCMRWGPTDRLSELQLLKTATKTKLIIDFNSYEERWTKLDLSGSFL